MTRTEVNWIEAERLVPGVSAEWDVLCVAGERGEATGVAPGPHGTYPCVRLEVEDVDMGHGETDVALWVTQVGTDHPLPPCWRRDPDGTWSSMGPMLADDPTEEDLVAAMDGMFPGDPP